MKTLTAPAKINLALDILGTRHFTLRYRYR